MIGSWKGFGILWIRKRGRGGRMNSWGGAWKCAAEEEKSDWCSCDFRVNVLWRNHVCVTRQVDDMGTRRSKKAKAGEDLIWEPRLQLSEEHLQLLSLVMWPRIGINPNCLFGVGHLRYRTHLHISTSRPLSFVFKQFGSTSKVSPSDWRAFGLRRNEWHFPKSFRTQHIKVFMFFFRIYLFVTSMSCNRM